MSFLLTAELPLQPCVFFLIAVLCPMSDSWLLFSFPEIRVNSVHFSYLTQFPNRTPHKKQPEHLTKSNVREGLFWLTVLICSLEVIESTLLWQGSCGGRNKQLVTLYQQDMDSDGCLCSARFLLSGGKCLPVEPSCPFLKFYN